MKYRFQTTPSFRKALGKLAAGQRESALRALAIFKADPFDPRLRTHKIHGLSVRFGRTIHSVWVEADSAGK